MNERGKKITVINQNFNHLIFTKTGISGRASKRRNFLESTRIQPFTPIHHFSFKPQFIWLSSLRRASGVWGPTGNHIQHVPNDKTTKETTILLQTAVVFIRLTFNCHAHKSTKKTKTSSHKSDGKITAERSVVKWRPVRQAFQTFIW